MSRSLPFIASQRQAPLRRSPAGVRAGALLALLLPLLGGCSGTRFGDALSRSFSSGTPAGTTNGSAGSAGAASGSATASTAVPAPGQASSGAGPAAAGAGGASPVSPVAAGAKGGKPAASISPAAAAGSRPAGNPSGAAATGRAAVSNNATTANPVATATPPRPAPYRVTILLPQADAAAPAEVVTQALRAAGVPFEVETIERLGRSNTPPPAPISRPAPEPR